LERRTYMKKISGTCPEIFFDHDAHMSRISFCL
jgi:hypothetical protein